MTHPQAEGLVILTSIVSFPMLMGMAAQLVKWFL